MLLDVIQTADKITSWIKDYLHQAGKKTLVLEINDHPASWVNALLCSKTNFTVLGYGKKLPNVPNITTRQFPDISQIKTINNSNSDLESSEFFQENINHSILACSAKEHQGIVAGWLSRERYQGILYPKRCTGDILPLGDLYLDEIKQLLEHLLPNSSDLLPQWGYFLEGLSEADITWALKEEEVSGIISSNQDPTKSRDWGRFTSNQRKVIAKLNQLNKINNHKKTDIPTCYLRDIPKLVRPR